MSDLTSLEKRKLEQVFGMEGGYVLDLNDRTFAEFIRESTGLDIEGAMYHANGRSKAKRLRTFWAREPNRTVGKLINDLLDYSEDSGAQAQVCRLIAIRLLGGTKPAPPKTDGDKAHESTAPAVDHKQYDRMATALNELLALPAHPRGFAFEKFLDDVFSTFGLAPRKSFRLVGEQIDGSFHLTNETYLVEAKWQDPKAGNRDLQGFSGTVRAKSSWARGLYVSYSGFSEEGLVAFAHGDATRIICIDGLELWQIVNQKLDLKDILSLKTRRAAETGKAHVTIRELYSL
jgi:hypothetical protein